jgi:hypothetical protein
MKVYFIASVKTRPTETLGAFNPSANDKVGAISAGLDAVA